MSQVANDMQRLYRELILDHSRNPRHFGRVDDATHTADGINPLCGDKLRLYLRIDDGGTITASGFEGSGCAISVASASLLADAVFGVTVDVASRWCEEVTTRLSDPAPGHDLSHNLKQLTALDGVREFPGRVKCATLAWHTVKAALESRPEMVTTE